MCKRYGKNNLNTVRLIIIWVYFWMLRLQRFKNPKNTARIKTLSGNSNLEWGILYPFRINLSNALNFFGYLNDSDNSISFTVINDKDVSLTEIMLELLITHEFLHLKQKEANNDLNTKLIDPVENINGYVNQWFEMEAYAYNIAYMKKKKNIDIDRGFDIIFHNRIENVYRGDNLIKFKKLIDEYLVIV